MLIDQPKLIELLIETSGLDEKKVEKQLAELVRDIRQAVEDGDAYEIPGFGMFTGFGDVLSFIPSKELETEINYKYIGMQPIELDEAQVSNEAESGVEESTEPDASDNPFAGLIDDEDIVEADKKAAEEAVAGADEEDAPGAEKWGIDTYKDDSAESVFGTMLGEDVFEEEQEATAEPEEEVIEDPFEDIIEEEASAEDSTQTETEQEASSEPEVEAEAGLEDELAQALEETEENPFEDVIEEEASPEPEPEPEKKEEKKKAKKKDVIPVIRDVSSGKGKKESKKKEEEPEAEKKEEEKKKKPKKNKKAEQQQASPLLLVATIIVVLGGAVFVLGYLDIIPIPGLGNNNQQPVVVNTAPSTPPPAAQTPTPESEPVENEDTPANNVTESTTAGTSTTTAGNAVVADDEDEGVEQESTEEGTTEVHEGDSDMGLFGKAEHEMADVYTIVLFSLSNEDNARAKIAELEADGLKARLTSYESERYGTLWRVSVGHFSSLRDAAIATDDLDEEFADTFFITKL